MTRKRMNIQDPTRINNYNNFLKTLDNNNIINNNINNGKIKLDEIKKTLTTEKEIKEEIEKIIDRINNNFKISDYSSSNFTGINQHDIDNNYIEHFMLSTLSYQSSILINHKSACFL